MILVLGGIGVVLFALAWIALVMWLSAKADRKHLERERLERVFGEGGQ